MKHFLFILLSLLFLYAHSADSNLVLWNADSCLVWDDFQGPADPNRKAGVQSAAQVMIELNYLTEGNRVNFTVACYFERHHSWTINRQSSYLLAHEQLHFDIAELYAREMRQRLGELSGLNHRNLESRVRHVYREVNREHNAFQDRYDRETNHSKNREKQVEWEAMVTRMLENSTQFSAESFFVSIK